MKYLLLALFIVGCSDDAFEEREKRKWEIAWWSEHDLRVGKKIKDPFNQLTVTEETPKMTKYGYDQYHVWSNGNQHGYFRKHITVKDSIIVSVWRQQ